MYREISDMSYTLVGIKILISQMYLEHHLSTLLQLHLHSHLNTWLQWIGQRQLQDDIQVLVFGAFYIRGLTVIMFHE